MVIRAFSYTSVPVQIEGSYSAIQRGTNHHKATGSKGNVGYAARVLGKRDETQAACGIPDFYLKMMGKLDRTYGLLTLHLEHLELDLPCHHLLR